MSQAAGPTRETAEAASPAALAIGSLEAEDWSEPDAAPGGMAGHLKNVADAVASAMEPFVEHVVSPVVDVIGSVIDAAGEAWGGNDAGLQQRLRRQAQDSLASLYELFPEARMASPRELGLRFVPIELIRGTAVAGAAQRGGDFLPLSRFRGDNWSGRWRRIRRAQMDLKPLPPIDLLKYAGEFWVLDGHNRVAATLHAGGVGLDAMVTELVPLDGRTTERPGSLLAYFGEADEMRAAAGGRRPATGMRQAEQLSRDGAATLLDVGDGPPRIPGLVH